MNFSDPEYLNRLLKQLNPDVLRAAEATMLKGDIANLELERDAAVASTVQSYNGEIAPLRARLAELEKIHAGEQVSLFKVVQLPHNFNEAMKVTAEEGPFNAAMNHAAKYPASQEPIGPVVPCYSPDPTAPMKLTVHKARAQKDGAASPEILLEWPELTISNEAIEGEKVRLEEKLWEPIESLEILNEYHTPKNAQVVTRDGQTFFVFKSAGYKAIAERLGFPYRPMMDGYKRYLLTPKEYDEVFKADQDRKSERRWRVEVGRPLEIDG